MTSFLLFLDSHLLSTTLFFCNLTSETSADATHIISLCYLRLNQTNAVAEHSKLFGKMGQHLGRTYVFGQRCPAIGRFESGINELEYSKSVWSEADNWVSIAVILRSFQCNL
jgi:anaphase-promoting complex subunit 3